MNLVESLGSAQSVLTWAAFGVPVLLWIWGWLHRGASESRVFGHLASFAVALGLLTMVVGALVMLYLHRNGTDLMTEVPAASLIAPVFFGLGTLFAATRTVPFSELRRYPLLRRVWALLSVAALIVIVLMVLKHTYWIVFSGIIGFLIVAIVAWTLFQKLFNRVVEPEPEDGDEDLFDEVADESRRRVGRFAEKMTLPRED